MKRLILIISILLISCGISLGGQEKPYSFPFIGKWSASEDPLLIDDFGFQDIQNLRKDGKRLKGVSGMTRANTAKIDTTYFYPENAFHFKKDFPSESHLMVFAYNSGDSAGYIYKDDSAVGSAGSSWDNLDFDDIDLETGAYSSTNIGRFALAPQENLVYCDGDISAIWGGDEMRITSFVTSTAAITNSITNPIDYSDQVTNTRSIFSQCAIVGGGLDSYTKLLMHCDGSDGGVTFTDSVGTHAPAAQGNAITDIDQLKFGSASMALDGANDWVQIADHGDFNWGTSLFTLDEWVRFGTQGNTDVIDSSSNNHTCTKAGTAALSDAEKKFGTESLWLDGDSDYVTIPDSTSWDVSASVSTEWTVECWFKLDDHAGTEYLVSQIQDANNYWALGHQHGTGVFFNLQAGGAGYEISMAGAEVTDSNWHHAVMYKKGTASGIYSLYVDGNQVDYGTYNVGGLNFTGLLYMGSFGAGSYTDGYIEEVRIYTGNPHSCNPQTDDSDTISIPTAAYSNDGSTELLLHMDIDTTAEGQHMLWSQADTTASDYIAWWHDWDEGKIKFQVMDAGALVTQMSGTWSPSTKTWYHLALIRGWDIDSDGDSDSDGFAITVDGSVVASTTDSDSLPNHDQVAKVGAITDTILIDESNSVQAVTAANGATCSTTQKKWGLGALYLDGVNDNATVPDSAGWDYFGSATQEYTIDFWLRLGDHTGTEVLLCQYEDANNYWEISHEDSGGANDGIRFIFQSGGGNVFDISGGEIEDTSWHHVAVCKWDDSGTTKIGIYEDGAIVAYVADNTEDTFDPGDAKLYIGSDGAPANYAFCYIDEIRIESSNIFSANPDAGLTDTITLPTDSYSSDSNTKLLLHANIMDFNGWIDEVRLSTGVARWHSSFTPFGRAYVTAAHNFVVGATRPLDGATFYMSSANEQSATLSVKEWNGNGWASLTVTDATSGLSTDGLVSWGSTTATSEPKYLNGMFLYWYQFNLSAGNALVSNVTAATPLQEIKDIWDGDERNTDVFLMYDASATQYIDYTTQVHEKDYDDIDEISYAQLTHAGTGMQTNDYLYAGYVERQTAIKVYMVTDVTNTNASVATVSYWDGTSWTAVNNLQDGTAENGATLSKTGVMSWSAPNRSEESVKTINNDTPLYYYRISVSAALDTTSAIDMVKGIPASIIIEPYDFAITFQNRLFLLCESEGEKNKAIYSNWNNPDIWNGTDSGELYFGGAEKLTAAGVIYNVYSQTGIDQLIVCKQNETYRVTGETQHYNVDESSQEWTVNPMSPNIGCVAPLSMAVCEIADVNEGTKRHALIWQAANGVVMCDGATIQYISDDISNYWDPNSSDYIPAARNDNSYGWYDPKLNAYKLLISSGSGQTTHNVELEYSLKYNEWTKLYREKTSGANPLQAGCVARDTAGNDYTYGLTDEGYMYQLENGNTWEEADSSTTGIAQYVWTKDLLLDDQLPLFFHTTIDYFRLNFETKSTTGQNISVTHYCDQTQTTDGSNNQVVPGAIDMDNGPYETSDCLLGECLYHSFKLSCTTTSVADGMELTGMGLWFTVYDTIFE